MFGKITNFLGNAVDFVGDAGGDVLRGLEDAYETIRGVPRQVVESGYDLERQFQGDRQYSTQPVQPQPRDNTPLILAGGFAALIVVLLLTQN